VLLCPISAQPLSCQRARILAIQIAANQEWVQLQRVQSVAGDDHHLSRTVVDWLEPSGSTGPELENATTSGSCREE
jgi:hypothetical protein